MAARPLTHVVHYLRRLAHRPEEASWADEVLLERFAGLGDDAAFTILLQRYGGLVWRVCRGSLTNVQDAEDAFQATFLVLASRAAAIRRGGSLRAWLHRPEAGRRIREQLEAASPTVDWLRKHVGPSQRSR